MVSKGVSDRNSTELPSLKIIKTPAPPLCGQIPVYAPVRYIYQQRQIFSWKVVPLLKIY